MAKQISDAANNAKAKIHMTTGDKIINLCFYLFIIAFAAICLIPFLLVISASFTEEHTLLLEGYKLIPSKLSLDAYKMVAESANLFQAYGVTIFVTLVGTALSMILSCCMAYAMSVKSFKSRNIVALFIYFTMLFSGGMVPSYLLIKRVLQLHNTIWVLILPSLCSAWNIMLLRNFFNGLPASLSESAKLDGANDIVILFKIILPISLPGIATISLFYALGYWNEWMQCLLYMDYNHQHLYTLQYLIQKMLRDIAFIQDHIGLIPGLEAIDMPTYSNRMATLVVAIGPIILVYPFIQKYFVKGLTVGSVKG